MALWQRARALFVSDEGPAAVEYAIMLALILVVCIVAIDPLGLAAQRICDIVCTALA